MKIQEIDLGGFILNLLQEKGISKGEFADRIGIKRQNANRDIFEKKSLDTNLVRRISEYLDYNLFTLFLDDNQYDYIKKQELKATLTIVMGKEKQDKSFHFVFGENNVEIKDK